MHANMNNNNNNDKTDRQRVRSLWDRSLMTNDQLISESFYINRTFNDSNDSQTSTVHTPVRFINFIHIFSIFTSHYG